MSIWIWMCALCVEYGHVFPLTELLADLSLCQCQTLQKPNVVCHHHLALHHMAMVVLHSPPFRVVGLFDFNTSLAYSGVSAERQVIILTSSCQRSGQTVYGLAGIV